MKNKRIVLNEGESLTIRLRGASEYEVTLQYEDVDELLLDHLGYTREPTDENGISIFEKLS